MPSVVCFCCCCCVVGVGVGVAIFFLFLYCFAALCVGSFVVTNVTFSVLFVGFCILFCKVM